MHVKSIIDSHFKVFVYVPPREKCVRPTLCLFRVRTHQVLLTHVCLWVLAKNAVVWYLTFRKWLMPCLAKRHYSPFEQT